MSFLQPAMLLALPLIALPILIHLINQNRYRTVPWAATMFLLQAKRMTRGMARLRYLLLMLARMLAVAGLIFAISRPMAGGWLGMTSSNAPEVTIVVLDRSVSMEEQNPVTSQSKRSTALKKLADLIQKTESSTQLVLFDSALQQPLEVRSVQQLEGLPEASATATTADMPTLLQQVAEYVESSEIGRADIWVCSDLRQQDWNPTAGRWEAVRQQLAAREGVRMFLLTYPDVAADNLAISVSGVHRREAVNGAELVMDLELTRATPTSEPLPVDVTFVIDGARSRLSLELTGSQLIRKGHAVPLDKDAREGWGRVELPRDSNLQDNVYRFVYAEPAVRRTVIVSDDEAAAEMFRIAAATASDRSLPFDAQVLPTAAASAIPWDTTAMIVWHAPLPADVVARQLEDFVQSGRSVMFFPPENPTQDTLFGAVWSEWRSADEGRSLAFKPWRTDSDLLANADSGTPLPVGQVQCFRTCGLNVQQGTPLWQLEDGNPLLIRAATDGGAVWFCSTLPVGSASTLVSNGVTFYVMLQRALARGAAALGTARHLPAGAPALQTISDWNGLDELSVETLVSQRAITAGLYRSGERLMAVNRPLQEDSPVVISDDTLAQVLTGLEFTRIDDTVGGAQQLASEIWRSFLILMLIALIAEALLCVPEAVPDRKRRSAAQSMPAA